MNPGAFTVYPHMLSELKRRGYYAIRETDAEGEVVKIIRQDGSGIMMVYRHKAEDTAVWDKWAEMTMNALGGGQ